MGWAQMEDDNVRIGRITTTMNCRARIKVKQHGRLVARLDMASDTPETLMFRIKTMTRPLYEFECGMSQFTDEVVAVRMAKLDDWYAALTKRIKGEGQMFDAAFEARIEEKLLYQIEIIVFKG